LSADITPWEITRGVGWSIAGDPAASLLDALERVGARPMRGDPRIPPVATRTSWPVSSAAYSLAVDRAISRGLAAIKGDRNCGFSAEYPDGISYGFTLLDILS
jgi:hypothetical protein